MRRIRLVIAMGTAAPEEPLRNKVRKPAEEVISYNKY
jgi:nitroreductase